MSSKEISKANDQLEHDNDIERQKLKIEWKKLEIEKESMKVERNKAKWTAASIILPVLAVLFTLGFNIWTEYKKDIVDPKTELLKLLPDKNEQQKREILEIWIKLYPEDEAGRNLLKDLNAKAAAPNNGMHPTPHHEASHAR